MFEIEFYVDYSDTDAMGVVHHSNYLRYFERARIAWFRHIGLPYSAMEQSEIYLPLKAANVEYIKPLFFEDYVKVKVHPYEINAVDVRVKAEIYRGEVLTSRGETHHVCCKKSVDPVTGQEKMRPCKIPDEWRQLWLQPNEKKS